MDLERDAGRQLDLETEPPAFGGMAPPPRPAPIRSRGWLIGAAVALAVLGGSWITTASLTHSGQPHIGISTTTGIGSPFGDAFVAADNQLTDRQWQERADGFRQFAGQGPVQLDRLTSAQGLDYVAKTIADPGLKGQLAQGVQEQKIEMVAIGFYDDCAEDGDVVRVQSGGVDVTVPLYHQVQYVEIPIPKGSQVEVTVSGIRDGTSGITLGMVTPRGDVHMPRLQPGEQVSFMAK